MGTGKFWFNLAKFYRYALRYGLFRALIKVRGTLHMKSCVSMVGERWFNSRVVVDDKYDVAIIGCGYFSFSNIAYFLRCERFGFLRYGLDTDLGRAKNLCAFFKGYSATTELADILNDPVVKVVFIASNHATHFPYAEECVRSGKYVHIEKPHVVSFEQLERLKALVLEFPGKIFLGFNRTKSKFFQKTLEVLRDESGPASGCCFIVGHKLSQDHWYYNPGEGGRILGNLVHWTDLVYRLIGHENFFPCRLIPCSKAGSDESCSISILCGDGSAISLNFSAYGSTSSGVFELLSFQRGESLVVNENFDRLTVDTGASRLVSRALFRDQGHGINIVNSVRRAREGLPAECDAYVVNTAWLVLNVERCVNSGMAIEIDAVEESTGCN